MSDDPTIVILAEHYGCVADVLAQRDRLRAELDDHLAGAAAAIEAVDDEKAGVEAERDRLRAVVEAAGTETGAIADITNSEIAADRSRNLSQWLQRQLDVSPTMGGDSDG